MGNNINANTPKGIIQIKESIYRIVLKPAEPIKSCEYLVSEEIESLETVLYALQNQTPQDGFLLPKFKDDLSIHHLKLRCIDVVAETRYTLGGAAKAATFSIPSKTLTICNNTALSPKNPNLDGEFNPELDAFLKQLPVSYNYIIKYASLFADSKTKLPMLLLHGEENSGKRLLIELFKTLFSRSVPIEYPKLQDSMLFVSDGISLKTTTILSETKLKTMIKLLADDNIQTLNLESIKGYHRVLTLQNSNNIQAVMEIFKAHNMLQKIKELEFNAENARYNNSLKRSTKGSWLLNHTFAKHIKFVIERGA